MYKFVSLNREGLFRRPNLKIWYLIGLLISGDFICQKAVTRVTALYFIFSVVYSNLTTFGSLIISYQPLSIFIPQPLDGSYWMLFVYIIYTHIKYLSNLFKVSNLPWIWLKKKMWRYSKYIQVCSFCTDQNPYFLVNLCKKKFF